MSAKELTKIFPDLTNTTLWEEMPDTMIMKTPVKHYRMKIRDIGSDEPAVMREGKNLSFGYIRED